MGTELECSINPIPSSENNSCSNFAVHFMDDYFRTIKLKDNCQKIEYSDRFPSSMDRLFEGHGMESIRKTMQMHEDIFKHQVRELHRLYGVQTKLMDELKKEINRSEFINRQHLMTQTSCGYNFGHVQGDPSSRERSSSCSGDTMKVARGFDLEIRPVRDPDISADTSGVEENQAAGPSVTVQESTPISRFYEERVLTARDSNSIVNSGINNETSIEGTDEDIEVELTLSVGGSRSSKKMPKNSKHHSHESRCTNYDHSIRQEIRELDSSASFKSDFSGPNTSISSSSSTFDQETKRQHWLFQGLSMNRT